MPNKIPQIEDSTMIKDVQIVTLKVHADKRGSFTETFRKEWFPQRKWDKIQTNRSVSKSKVIRGLHYHFYQVDYWFVASGRLRAALYDLRPDSPTYQRSLTVEMGGENQIGLFIPIGVAHGFAALSDAVLVYIVDNYYNDGADEHGIAWDDPDIAMPWGVESPIVSSQDIENLKLKDIPPEKLPQA